MTDISKEAVDQALAEIADITRCVCSPAYTERGLHSSECHSDSEDALQTLRAQAARIEQLTDERDRQYEQNAEFIVKIAELEAQLRDVCLIIGQYDEESTCPSCCDATAINEAVTALIKKEPTT